MLIKNLKSGIRRTLNAFGVDIVAYAGDWKVLRTLEAPTSIIDVGVGFGTPVLYQAYPLAPLLLVEPSPHFHKHIRDEILSNRDGKLFAYGAGSNDSTMVLYSDRRFPLMSSVLERTDLSKTTGSIDAINVPIKRIDSFLTPKDLGNSAILKIDVEGYELEVLLGLGDLVKHIAYLILECNVADAYFGAPSIETLMRWTNLNGFDFKSLLTAQIVHGEYRYIDLLFKRSGLKEDSFVNQE